MRKNRAVTFIYVYLSFFCGLSIGLLSLSVIGMVLHFILYDSWKFKLPELRYFISQLILSFF